LLLTIARDEWHGRAFGKQFGSGGDGGKGYAALAGDGFEVMGHECEKIFFRKNFEERKSKQISLVGQDARPIYDHEKLSQYSCS
jgi:hypothetical protein